MKRIGICLIIAAFLWAVLVFAAPEPYFNSAALAENAQNGGAAPDFTVYDQDGCEVHLSDFIGRPVVVNFWATWCGNCIKELPAFQKVYSEYGDRIVFLMIDAEDDPELAAAFVQAMGYTFPVCYDTEYDALLSYQIAEVPCTLMFDAEGRLVRRQTGSMTQARLAYCVTQLLPAVNEEEPAASVGVIGGADGPTNIYLAADPSSAFSNAVIGVIVTLLSMLLIAGS